MKAMMVVLAIALLGGAVAAPSTLRVTAHVGSSSSFRLSVEFVEGLELQSSDPPHVEPLDSPSLDADRDMANFTRVTGDPDGDGIRTSFGELLIADDGRFTLKDADGAVVARAIAPPVLAAESTGHAGITMQVSGSKTGPGATGLRPCLVNGGWGAPFTWDPIDNFFAFAVSTYAQDPDYIHCYPVSFDGPKAGAARQAKTQDTCTTLTHVVPYGNMTQELPMSPVKVGGDHERCCAACNDISAAGEDCSAWVVDLNATHANLPDCHLYACVDQWVPPDLIGGDDNQFFSGGLESRCAAPAPPPPAQQRTGAYEHDDAWFGLGRRVDWYLAPTPRGGFDFTAALFDLTGAPAVPPLYGMGLMATYWGYDNMSQVEQYMHEFRSRAMPIDSFIMDYDWFGAEPCHPPAQGGYNCGDYGYRDGWWNNISFTQPDGSIVHCETAADVFDHFHSPPLNMHFGGIRKPRTYSNKALCEKNGWLLPNASDVGEGGDINLDFSVPSMRAWYTSTQQHFLDDGMDFWWNDEGETSWFTYLLWNQAQTAQFAAARPNTRHFTINRAWQPGMQRFPAVAWTGDGQVCTHQELLRGMLNGCPLTSCDLTSPDATTLVRQYQSAVFTPIMRVHQMKGTPRFPWFWPDPSAKSTTPAAYSAHQAAFRGALEMRYRFLPFLYSLAHAAHRHGRPIAHPASFAFPDECSGSGPHATRQQQQQCAAAESTYMVGSVVIPASLGGLVHTNEVVTTATGAHPAHENVSTATLPAFARWYRWNTTAAVAGGRTVTETLALADIRVYIRAGAVLPLQAGRPLQRTAEAGGELEVQIYAGADGGFDLVEDDGISLAYQSDPSAATRTTTWRWNDTARSLTWSVTGSKQVGLLPAGNLYTSVSAVLFEEGADAAQRAARQPLAAAGGQVVFPRAQL